ncbi:MAG: leucine-rich repeat protein [Clostridia bacterium]|nr:leucine-rich repeat protein [Clostridia bacterium]
MKKALTLILAVIMMFPLTSCNLYKYLSNRTYTIHFNANGGEGEMDDFLVESGAEGYIPNCTFTKEGYECVAWGLDPDGKKIATHLANMTLTLPISVKNGGTIQLYAIWTTPGFEFKYNGIGFFHSVSIEHYFGNANHVIVPTWFQGSIGSGHGSCSVDSFSSGVFKGHTEIESIKNIPLNLSKDLFNGCTSLETIKTRGSIISIGDRAFYNCSKLQNLNLAKNLNSIGEEAFYMCTSIERLVIPATLDELGDKAFYGWTENQVIEFTKYAENPFGKKAFKGCNATIIWSGKLEK